MQTHRAAPDAMNYRRGIDDRLFAGGNTPMAIIRTGRTSPETLSTFDDRSLAKKTNTFWIGANLLFDTQTGATNQVLMFVHSEAEASPFPEPDATAYLNFVSVRADRFNPGIKWTIQPARLVPQRFVIKGEQDVV